MKIRTRVSNCCYLRIEKDSFCVITGDVFALGAPVVAVKLQLVHRGRHLHIAQNRGPRSESYAHFIRPEQGLDFWESLLIRIGFLAMQTSDIPTFNIIRCHAVVACIHANETISH